MEESDSFRFVNLSGVQERMKGRSMEVYTLFLFYGVDTIHKSSVGDHKMWYSRQDNIQ